MVLFALSPSDGGLATHYAFECITCNMGSTTSVNYNPG